MKTHLVSLMLVTPIAMALSIGGAAAQRQGGGGNDGGSPSREGSDSGVTAAMTCATGAYCPSNRNEPRQPPRRFLHQDPESCDQVRVREHIPGTNRYRTVYRCQWDR